MPPAVDDQLRLDVFKPGLDHVDEVPKGSKTVTLENGTYLLPVRWPEGFKFTALKKPKTYSIGALANE